jgi:hypothetical protein
VKLVEEVLLLDTEVEKEKISLRNLSVIPDLTKEIVELQLRNHELREFKEKEMKRDNHEFQLDDGGAINFRDWLYVANDIDLKKKILNEAHKSQYTNHLGETKMYRDLKKVFRWLGVKKEMLRVMYPCS